MLGLGGTMRTMVEREIDSKFDRRAQRSCRRDVTLLGAAARHAMWNSASGSDDAVEDDWVGHGCADACHCRALTRKVCRRVFEVGDWHPD
jgi:hypothetical protein